jgi:hypothetical protein
MLISIRTDVLVEKAKRMTDFMCGYAGELAACDRAETDILLSADATHV